MARYECTVCGYVYDESKEGRKWDSLADGWKCPICGAERSQFTVVGAEPSEATTADARSPLFGNRAVFAHRVFGYAFLALYVVLLVQMIPRLWTYQVEFPARTVVHLALGMAIGAALILKISIVRYFRRLEQSLVPALGTSLVVGSVVLIGISVPPAFREAAATRRLFTEENRQRVQTLLARTGLDDADCARFASLDSLRAGQQILRQQCIECHDLRLVLAKPRTPQNWRQTVSRMADRTTMLSPLDEKGQWQVTAYLVALSPQLQRSTQQLRNQQDRRQQVQENASAVATETVAAASYEAGLAQQLFETKCSQCHKTALVGMTPPASLDEAKALVARMVEEGLEATEQELSILVQYLTKTYAKKSE